MTSRSSNRADVIKLENLIKRYFINKDDLTIRNKLNDMPNINGEDLFDALNNINLETEIESYKKLREDYEDLKTNYEEVHKYYEQQKEDQEKLINALELLLNDPFFKFINKINDLTKIFKEVKYP
jgi:hypothetical protein